MIGNTRDPQLIQVAYDCKSRTLTVWLSSRRRVTHRNVAPRVYEQLVRAPSSSDYYARYIARSGTGWRVKRQVLMVTVAVATAVLDPF